MSSEFEDAKLYLEWFNKKTIQSIILLFLVFVPEAGAVVSILCTLTYYQIIIMSVNEYPCSSWQENNEHFLLQQMSWLTDKYVGREKSSVWWGDKTPPFIIIIIIIFTFLFISLISLRFTLGVPTLAGEMYPGNLAQPMRGKSHLGTALRSAVVVEQLYVHRIHCCVHFGQNYS